MQGGRSPDGWASEPSAGALSTLNVLQIKKAKRSLRLAGAGGKPPYASLQKLYGQNRFEALLREAASLKESEKDAPVFLIEGNSLFFLGRLEAAVSAYQEAFRRAARPEEKAAALSNFGLVFSEKGRWKDAIHWLEKALEIDRASDNWQGQGIVLSLLGNFYLQSGNPEKGSSAHIESLEIAETIPIPWLQARQLSFLGNLYSLDRIFHIAEDDYRKALALYQKLDDPLGEAAALSGLSFVLKDQGAFEDAVAKQAGALSIYQRLGDLKSEIRARVNLSLIYRDQGNFEAAIHAAKLALGLQKRLGDVQGMAETEGTLGTIYQKKGELKEALQHLKKARRHFEEGGASQQIHIVDLSIQAIQDQIN